MSLQGHNLTLKAHAKNILIISDLMWSAHNSKISTLDNNETHWPPLWTFTSPGNLLKLHVSKSFIRPNVAQVCYSRFRLHLQQDTDHS